MNIIKGFVAFIIVSVCVTSVASAADINKREAAQRQSIRAGVQDGSLTAREAHRLGHRQVKMERKEQRFRSDGVLTKRERANLHATADANRAAIYRQRHNDQVRDIED